MTAKIRIKAGDIEVEFEGTEKFIKEELLELVSSVTELKPEFIHVPGASSQVSVESQPEPAATGLRLSAENIAAKLGVNVGRDLLVAAAVKLQLGDGKAIFTRKEVLEEMKTAASYFSESTHTKNLTAMLKALITDDLINETSKGKYSLTASAKSNLSAQLA